MSRLQTRAQLIELVVDENTQRLKYLCRQVAARLPASRFSRPLSANNELLTAFHSQSTIPETSVLHLVHSQPTLKVVLLLNFYLPPDPTWIRMAPLWPQATPLHSFLSIQIDLIVPLSLKPMQIRMPHWTVKMKNTWVEGRGWTCTRED